MASALVVGFGSIGARHARLLREAGETVAVVSRRAVDWEPRFADLPGALAEAAPGTVVIANDTASHGATLSALAEAGFRGRVLVEKPLLAEPAALPRHRFERLAVGYQLRFHPGVQRLRQALAGERIVSACLYVGQHLAGWRPGRDYRTTESAARERGGGALRDLSHELDLAAWLFGSWRRVAAIGGKLSALEIDSDDAWAVLIECESCPAVTLQMNYLNRPGRRFMVVETRDRSFELDLIAGTLLTDGREERFAVERDGPLRALHAALLGGKGEPACTAEEGLAVVALIAAIERSAAEGSWSRP
ncbi:MAG: Gfo/Idh/MocA family protein [Kiloniellales bacterium]